MNVTHDSINLVISDLDDMIEEEEATNDLYRYSKTEVLDMLKKIKGKLEDLI